METPRKTRFNEEVQTVSFRVPKSKVEDFKERGHSVLAMYSISQYADIVNNPISEIKEITKNSSDYKEVVVEPKTKFIKEPSRVSVMPPFVKAITIVGYGCKKDENSDKVYRQDELTSAMEWDNETHAKEWLLKNKT